MKFFYTPLSQGYKRDSNLKVRSLKAFIEINMYLRIRHSNPIRYFVTEVFCWSKRGNEGDREREGEVEIGRQGENIVLPFLSESAVIFIARI